MLIKGVPVDTFIYLHFYKVCTAIGKVKRLFLRRKLFLAVNIAVKFIAEAAFELTTLPGQFLRVE